jgi:hypothetical protein
VHELFARASSDAPHVVSEEEVERLPEAARRWLVSARIAGKPRPRTVRLRQEGRFRLGADRPWLPFRAEQYYTTEPAGFVWFARMRAAPLVIISVRDRYFDGRGSIDARLLSLMPVARASGPELDQGALLRYLNEAAWFPAAMLSPHITWEAIDASSSRATMSYAGVAASATFTVDARGDLTTMVAERYRAAGGRFVLDTWETPVSEYQEFNDVRMPVRGEGVWQLDSGAFSYIQLRVTDVEYDRPEIY